MRVTISVTNRDIERGCRSECCSCPIALAINRRLKEQYNAHVNRTFLRLFKKHAVNWGTVLPIRVMTFVDQFDDCKAVKPFRFQVDIPKKYLRERGVRRNG